MSDFESLINKRLYERATMPEPPNELNFGKNPLEEQVRCAGEEEEPTNINSNEIINEKIDKGYEYLLKMHRIFNEIKNIKLIDRKAETKFKDWINIIEQDFMYLLDNIANYTISIKVTKDSTKHDSEASEDRRRIAHNNLMSSIVKTIRDIKFNFDINYDKNGKNYIFKQNYINNLNKDQKNPNFLTVEEIEKIDIEPNLFLPEIFNDCSIPSYKYLSDSNRRKHITKWAEDIYHSNVIGNIEKIKKIL